MTGAVPDASYKHWGGLRTGCFTGAFAGAMSQRQDEACAPSRCLALTDQEGHVMSSSLAGRSPYAPDPSSPSRVRGWLSRRAVIGGAVTAAAGLSLTAGVVISRERDSSPTFDGASGWLNTDPLGPAELRGSVVLVNFWTFTCINWLRTVPYVREWSRSYRADGLVVIGVHTPEFAFEHDLNRVRGATRERGIDYPVAIDNDYEIWRAFDNTYWPALYFLDMDGTLRHHHFGEGDYERSETRLQQMLGVRRPLVSVAGDGVEAGPDWRQLQSPETYLGYGRGTGFASSPVAAWDERQTYALPAVLPLNSWALVGEWTVGSEHVKAGETGGSIVHRFHARDAHLVLSSSRSEPIPFRILLDGAPPGLDHGEDIDKDGNGILRDSRLYQLIRAHDIVKDRVLQITFDEPGALAYAFTFG